jgi:hypothetical protein
MACVTVNLFIATVPSLLTPQFVISIIESVGLRRCCTFCMQVWQGYSCEVCKSCMPLDNFTLVLSLPSPTLSLHHRRAKEPPEDESAAPPDHNALSVKSRCPPSWAQVTTFMQLAIQLCKIHARTSMQSRKASLNGLRNEVFGCAFAWIAHPTKIDTTHGTGTVHQFQEQPWIGSEELFSKCRENCRDINRKSKLSCARD